MPVSDWSTTPGSNTSISGINLAEGCAASGVNNAIRQMMADVKTKTDAIDTTTTDHESRIDVMEGSVVSGIRGYTTWANLNAAFAAYNAGTAYVANNTCLDQGAFWVNILASTGTAPPTLPTEANANWRLITQTPSGLLAQVPTTDTGTHTDPVVGGTVANSGIFRYSTSPAGWERIYSTEAALAETAATDAETFRDETEALLESAREIIAAQYGFVLGAKAGGLWDLAYWETTLFQDSAATTPVTASGQLIGCIRNRLGDTDWDLVQTDNAKRPTFKFIDGVPYVEAGDGTGLHARATHTLTVPLYMVAGLKNVDSGHKFGIFSRTVGTWAFTPDSLQTWATYADFGGTPKYVKTPPYTAPSNTIGVVDAVYRDLEGDIRLNNGGEETSYSPLALALNEGDTMPTATFGLNISEQSGVGLATGTPYASNASHFFGGAILQFEPSDEERSALVSYFRAQIEPEMREDDQIIIVIGDSTFDDIDNSTSNIGEGPVYRWATESTASYLRALNPTDTIYYRIWSYRAQQWCGFLQAQAGSSGRRIFVENASVSGSQPSYHLGDRFADTFIHPHIDEVIWAHGHNMAVNYSAVTGTAAQYLRAGEWADAMDRIRSEFPEAAHLVVNPHPNMQTGNESIEAVNDALNYICGLYADVEFADIYTAWDTAGRPSGWHTGDFVHPSYPTGTDEQLAVFVPAYSGWVRPDAPAAPLLGRTSSNILPNGLFDEFDGAVPDDWTLSGAGTCAKSTLRVDEGDYYAVRLTQTTGATYLEETVSATAYQGSVVCLAVRQYIEAGGALSSGRIVLHSDGTGAVPLGNAVYDTSAKPTGAWRWAYFYAYVPSDATTLTVRLYAAGSGIGDVHYGRAVLVSGSRPKNVR